MSDASQTNVFEPHRQRLLRARSILMFDSLGGLLVGATVLLFAPQLAVLYGLEIDTVLGIGLANCAYGAASGRLLWRINRGVLPSRRSIQWLASANAAWSVVSVALLSTYWSSASAYGLLHVAGEGLYCLSLAYAEWRWVRPIAIART